MHAVLQFLFAHPPGLLDHLGQCLIQIRRRDLLEGHWRKLGIRKNIDPHDIPAPQFHAHAAQATGLE